MKNTIKDIPEDRKRWFIENNKQTLRNQDAWVSGTGRIHHMPHNDSPLWMNDIMHGMTTDGSWGAGE